MQPASIIATVLNEAGDIPRLVESLLAQDPQPGEVILVDGGSIDGTWEWLEAAAIRNPLLKVIRDETCNFKYSPGPIARGRNVAIRAATSPIIACADAGCSYSPDWLANLTAPLASGEAEYVLGGSCLDTSPGTGFAATACTIWDLASAPFFSIRLSPDEPTKSCTARSMAFLKSLWEGIGGFPEHLLMGEDTFFDLEARSRTSPAFVANAKAYYRPQNSFRSAAQQLARYAFWDGRARLRWSRLSRNAARCLLELLALASFNWTVAPLLVVLVLESWYAFHRDWRDLRRFGARAVLARFAFSAAVPWIVAANQIRGCFSKQPATNRQNVPT